MKCQKIPMFRNILSQVESQTISAGGDLGYDVKQWFSAAGDFVPQATFDNVWRQFGCRGGGRELLVLRSLRPRGLLRTIQRAVSTTKNYLAPNVYNGEVGKLPSTSTSFMILNGEATTMAFHWANSKLLPTFQGPRTIFISLLGFT